MSALRAALLHALCILPLSSLIMGVAGITLVLALQKRKLRHREVEWLAQVS